MNEETLDSTPLECELRRRGVTEIAVVIATNGRSESKRRYALSFEQRHADLSELRGDVPVQRVVSRLYRMRRDGQLIPEVLDTQRDLDRTRPQIEEITPYERHL